MLKKVSHILLSFLLLVTTTGLTINRHYCGDNLESISIFSEPQSCCEMPNCCHNESIVIQLEEDFSISSFNISFEQIAVVLPNFSSLFNADLQEISDFKEFVHTPLKNPIKTVLSSIQSFLL